MCAIPRYHCRQSLWPRLSSLLDTHPAELAQLVNGYSKIQNRISRSPDLNRLKHVHTNPRCKNLQINMNQTFLSRSHLHALLEMNCSCMSLSGKTVDNLHGASYAQYTKHTHSIYTCHTWYIHLNEQLFTILKPQI